MHSDPTEGGDAVLAELRQELQRESARLRSKVSQYQKLLNDCQAIAAENELRAAQSATEAREARLRASCYDVDLDLDSDWLEGPGDAPHHSAVSSAHLPGTRGSVSSPGYSYRLPEQPELRPAASPGPLIAMVAEPITGQAVHARNLFRPQAAMAPVVTAQPATPGVLTAPTAQPVHIRQVSPLRAPTLSSNPPPQAPAYNFVPRPPALQAQLLMPTVSVSVNSPSVTTVTKEFMDFGPKERAVNTLNTLQLRPVPSSPHPTALMSGQPTSHPMLLQPGKEVAFGPPVIPRSPTRSQSPLRPMTSIAATAPLMAAQPCQMTATPVEAGRQRSPSPVRQAFVHSAPPITVPTVVKANRPIQVLTSQVPVQFPNYCAPTGYLTNAAKQNWHQVINPGAAPTPPSTAAPASSRTREAGTPSAAERLVETLRVQATKQLSSSLKGIVKRRTAAALALWWRANAEVSLGESAAEAMLSRLGSARFSTRPTRAVSEASPRRDVGAVLSSAMARESQKAASHNRNLSVLLGLRHLLTLLCRLDQQDVADAFHQLARHARVNVSSMSSEVWTSESTSFENSGFQGMPVRSSWHNPGGDSQFASVSTALPSQETFVLQPAIVQSAEEKVSGAEDELMLCVAWSDLARRNSLVTEAPFASSHSCGSHQEKHRQSVTNGSKLALTNTPTEGYDASYAPATARLQPRRSEFEQQLLERALERGYAEQAEQAEYALVSSPIAPTHSRQSFGSTNSFDASQHSHLATRSSRVATFEPVQESNADSPTSPWADEVEASRRASVRSADRRQGAPHHSVSFNAAANTYLESTYHRASVDSRYSDYALPKTAPQSFRPSLTAEGPVSIPVTTELFQAAYERKASVAHDDSYDDEDVEEDEEESTDEILRATNGNQMTPALFGEPDEVAKRRTLATQALGVNRDAGRRTVTKAFRSHVRSHHPDKGGDPKNFQVLHAAYSSLCSRKSDCE